MNLERRTFNGESWPEKRVSISNKDNGHCLFVNARYAEISESEMHADYIVNAVNHVDALADALDSILAASIRMAGKDDFYTAQDRATEALKSYRGDK